MENMAGDGPVCIAVGKDFEESKLTLLWALENLRLKKVGILHVHQPAKTITFIGGSFPVSRLEQNELRSLQKIEKQIMHTVMDDYLRICHQAGVEAEKLHIETNNVTDGIVKLIHRHDIKKLVMGAAADKHYSEGMTDLQSEKALYINRNAPLPCQIWFICRGKLILTRRSPGSSHLRCSKEVASSSNLTASERRGNGHHELHSYELLRSEGNLDCFPPFNEGNSDDKLHDQVLLEALTEVEKLKQEAFEELAKRVKAEKAAIRAISRYIEESKRRKEIEAAFAAQKEDLEKIKQQRNEENLIARDQKMLLEGQIASAEYSIEQLKEEKASAEDRLDVFRREREELLRKQEEENSSMQQFFCVFSVSDIHEATDEFDPSLKIREGAYARIFKGTLRHTTVAIKVLRQQGLQGPSEFQQEVDVLSKVRHPNLVTFIGACPDILALIYEYLPNGSLKDRLSCRDNTASLSWQTRIQIATQLCSVLIFLHSNKPHRMVHGNLKPGNILLDANFVCKLSYVGANPALALQDNSAYLDPQLLTTGRLSPSSDIYSFGIILLQLLTGRPPQDIAELVQEALDRKSLSTLLDPTAGDWPLVETNRLAYYALRCCNENQSRRPDLASEVLRVLESTTASCGASSSAEDELEQVRASRGAAEPEQSSRAGSADHHLEPPEYFLCPIFQEVMEDPHVAADGYTYEKEALETWLAVKNTSPMTNLPFAHRNLLPNRALRSEIQEWKQRHDL